MIQPESNNREEDQVSLYLACCDGNEFSVPPGGWLGLLTLAQQHGWCPTGTEAPEYPWLEGGVIDEEDLATGTYWLGRASEWRGLYFPGYGQRVSDRDARALGAALERALPDVPEEDACEHLAPAPGGRGISLERTWRRGVSRQTNPLELYSGEEKEVLRWLIAHCCDCGGGGFWIWSYESR
jgi:hypothetical protein